MKPTRRTWASALTVTLAMVISIVPVARAIEPANNAKVATADAKSDTPVALAIRQSRIIQTPWAVTRVSVADPKVADVRVLTPRQVMLLGKSVGSTDLLIWGEREELIQRRIDVTVPFDQLTEQLTALLPGAKLQVSQVHDVLTVSGHLRRAEHVDQLRRFLDASGMKYVDLTSLAGVHQVQIKVRVAEVSRTAVRALGFNALVGGSDFFGGLTIGAEGGGPLNPISIGAPAGSPTRGIPFLFTETTSVSPAVTAFGGVPRADLEFFIQALAENQYMRILATPSLIARSGEEASFLVGGEYPIPVVQGSGTSLSTSITIEYREFGVRLHFRPTVLGDGTIRLHVAPEVSQLSDVGAVEIEGFRIPSLLTRRAQTELELKSGQSFAMAGLIQRVSTGRNSRIPFFGDVPILGTLFRSTRFQTEETELVVLVTASLVEPISNAETPLLPGVLHTDPNDWDFYVEGRLQGRCRPVLSAAQAARMRQLGLDELKGPGAWASYDRPAPASQTHTVGGSVLESIPSEMLSPQIPATPFEGTNEAGPAGPISDEDALGPRPSSAPDTTQEAADPKRL